MQQSADKQNIEIRRPGGEKCACKKAADSSSKQAACCKTALKISRGGDNQCQHQQITGGYPLYERGADIKFVHERGEGDVHSSFDNHAAKGHNAGGDDGK